MKIGASITNAIASLLKHPTKPQVPAAPASPTKPNVGFAFNDHTGDPNRNLYASHMKGVLRSATQDDAVSRKLVDSYNAGLLKAVASEVASAETEPVGIKKYAMEKMYLEAGKNLEKFLKANRFPIPGTILKGKLTYAEDAAIRAREIAFKDLGRADADPDVLALKKGDIKQRLQGERQLAKYKNLFNFTKAKLADDVETLTELFIPVTNSKGIRTGVKLKAETIDDLASFFEEKFNIQLKASETRNARQAFLSAQIFSDPARQAGTRLTGPTDEQRKILDQYLARLLSKLPLATGSPSNATEDAAISAQGIFRLAEAVASEAVVQARVADIENCTAFWVSGGSSLVVKGSKEDEAEDGGESATRHELGKPPSFDFKLCQPYGQENNQRCFYELAFSRNESTQQYDLRLQRLLPGEDNQPPTIESIPLEGDAAAQRKLLEGYFSKSDLKLLFGPQPGIGHKSFPELYGHLKAQTMKDDKIEDIVYQHLDSAIADHFGKEGIDSIQGTGYFYNKGLYGKDYLTDMRGPYNSRVAKLLVAGKLAATGSCGFQQDLIHAQRGKIISIPNVTKENYLNSFHGNDPQEVNEKQTIHAIVPNSARAAEYEAALETVHYDHEETRQGMAGTPISHLDNRAALKAIDADMNVVNASRRNVWAPRENVPLSIPVSIERNVGGEVRVDTRNYQFRIRGKEVLMASAHLSLTHAEGAELRKDGTISQEELAACRSLQLTHMLPEGWSLRDDEGKAVLDPETREPVQLLEKVIVRPVVTGTTIDKVVDTVEKEFGNKDDPGKNKTINVPLFEDETGSTVLEKRNEFGEPVLQFNADGLLSPVFVNEAGERAAGKVTPRTKNVRNEVRGFEIIGIERWVREPIEDPARPGTAKTRGDHVLCTYVKKVQSADKGNLNPLILCDPVYTTINCVHSQNGLNTPAANESMGPLDTVGHSYKPGDTPYAQDQIMAISKDRPYPHPVAVQRGLPREGLVTEDVVFTLGGGVGASASQPHRDMDNSGFSPYTLYEHREEVPEETRGQRYGNREAIGQGRILKARQEHLEKVMEKAQAAIEHRKKFANSEIIAPLIAKLGRLDLDGAKPWTLYENTRNKNDLDKLLALLAGVEHVFTDDCARRLKYQKAYLDEVSSALDALNARLQDVRNAIDTAGSRNMTDHSFLDTRLQQIAAMQGYLGELVERYSDSSTFAEVKSSVKAIVDSFGVIEEQLKKHIEKKSGSGSVDRDESADPYVQLDIELAQCKNAIKGLQVWERQPDAIRSELVDAMNTLKAELEKDWTKDAPHPLISHLVDGHQGATTPGNDKLAGRYRTGSGDDLHALLALRDIDDTDSARFEADKEAINDRLTQRLAELRNKALEMNALKGTSEFDAAGFEDVQQEIDRITTAQIAYQDARDMASLDADDRAIRIAGLDAELNARLDALKQMSETHTGMSPEGNAGIMQDTRPALQALQAQEPLQLETAQIKRRLAAWKTFDRQVRVFESPEPVLASLVRIGKVGVLDEMRAVESQMVPAAPSETSESNEALLPHRLMALLDQDSSEARDSELKSICGQLASLGLFPELNDPEKPVAPEAQSDMLFNLLTQPENAEIVKMNDKAPMASAALHNALADLQQIIDAAKPKEGALADDGFGRNRAQYAYPARGRAVPAGLLAGMAMNAPVNASFGIVSEAMKSLELQISAALELAANGVAIGADIFPGGVTMLAGAGMMKEGVFKHNRLRSIRPGYERSLNEYRTIQQEILSLHEEMKTRMDDAGRESASSQQAVMEHISQVIGPRVETLQSRLLAIDNELRRAAIDAMSGAALAGAGATGLTSAVVKTATTTATGATAASAMGMAAGGLLTVLGAFQLGMSINELRRLRHDFATAHAQRGRGEDSGLRRAHMIRTNELVEAHKRKIRLWTAFTAGSTAMTAGGALMATGVAAAGGAALSGAGAVAVAGSVYSLFHEPRDLRNRAARAADNTVDTRDAVINNDRLLNLFLHKNANQANRAAEAINEIVDNALDDTPRSLSSSGKEFRHQFKKTVNVRSWVDIDAQRRILSKRIETRLDATKDQQLILMTYTNIQELDYLKQELASVRNEVVEIDSAIAITRALLLKNHQHLESLKARNAPAASPDTATDEVRESGTELQTQIRHADALQKRLQVQVAQLQSAKRMVTPRLERTESRYRAVSDLQDRLDLFGSELDRDFRASTREQFDDLRLRFMLTNHLLVSAMGRKEAKLLAQAHHLDRLDAGNEAQSFMKAYIDGRLFDGKNDVGPVPIKGKLERIDIELSEACLAWLKSPPEGGTTPRVGDINRLFATAMCVSLPDRCADERNIVLDMHTERLKLYLAEQQKAPESPQAAVGGGKPRTRIKAAVSKKMGALSGKLQLRTKPVPARGAAEVAGAATAVRSVASSSSSTRTVELAVTRVAETQARQARLQPGTQTMPPLTVG